LLASNFIIALLFTAFIAVQSGGAQETIFNVPSGDILDKGKIYSELDFAYSSDASTGVYSPRLVAGIGHKIEIGANLNGIASSGPSQATLIPTLKWKAYDGKNGWGVILGDNVFLPIQNRNYDVGNYVYAEFTKALERHTRLTFGAFDFTSKVVASGNKAGGQFGIEQSVGHRVTLAADWFTGKHSAGYLTPGVALKLTSKVTGYTAYEIGNSDLSRGNHLLLLEVGWNFN
jgi:hypothetical protein